MTILYDSWIGNSSKITSSLCIMIRTSANTAYLIQRPPTCKLARKLEGTKMGFVTKFKLLLKTI